MDELPHSYDVQCHMAISLVSCIVAYTSTTETCAEYNMWCVLRCDMEPSMEEYYDCAIPYDNLCSIL